MSIFRAHITIFEEKIKYMHDEIVKKQLGLLKQKKKTFISYYIYTKVNKFFIIKSTK